MENIYLIGFMGAGKSVISQNLQKRLGWKLIDTDEFIVEREGCSIKRIFAKKGEEYFRDLETLVLKEISSEKNMIVSCGGGIVLRLENVSVMKESGRVILLTASPEEIYNRISKRHERPLSDGKSLEEISEMMESRRSAYESASDITVRSDEYSPYATAAKIQRLLGLGSAPLTATEN